MTRRSILTVLAAVLGLALSAALAWSASQLAGQRIGLASEPLAVTQGLAPHPPVPVAPKPTHAGHPKPGTKPASAHPAPAPSSTSSSPIFSTPSAAPPPVTAAAPAPPVTTSAPAAARTTAPSSSAASPASSSSGGSRHRDDHHPDD